ncbi:polysaccharide pyruvyl transferase family protein [Enterococcus faecalis]|uniref:polysaccharide pyruvyl transferase family protein n=1 Tax=Enterococcus faecalis TaxID=1351 RepID=UPI0025B00646|nr:polysaccharide pyruvyl transferase family protein [Enterococcus faecalis]MDN3185222.1 polysaccharide pyruvyl transferase family protein [Enterococcus faecalis]
MKALLVSYFDSTNIGDQLIYKTIEEELLADLSVVKFCYNLTKSDEIILPNMYKKRSIFQKIYGLFFKKLPFSQLIVAFFKQRKLDKSKIESFVKELKKVDVVVFGGGNAIFDLSAYTSSAEVFDRIVSLAKLENKKIFVSGIGIGPFATEKQRTAAISTLEKCDVITFRDEKSYQYVVGTPAEPISYLLADPVFSLPEEPKNKHTNAKYDIGFCIIDYYISGAGKKEVDKYLNDTLYLIKQLLLKDSGIEITLFSSELNDYEYVIKLKKMLQFENRVRIVYVNSPDNLIELYQTLDVVVGTRMHSMIVAVSQLIPIVGFSWQQKVDEMFKMIDCPNDVYDIQSLDSFYDEIITKIRLKAMDVSIYERTNLIAIKEKMKKDFNRSQQLFQEMLMK